MFQTRSLPKFTQLLPLLHPTYFPNFMKICPYFLYIQLTNKQQEKIKALPAPNCDGEIINQHHRRQKVIQSGMARTGVCGLALGGVQGLHLQKLMTLFVKNMLFCHDFENDLAVFAFIVDKYSI